MSLCYCIIGTVPSIAGRLEGVATGRGFASSEFLLRHPKFAPIRDHVILIDPVDMIRHNFTRFAFFGGYEAVQRRAKAIEASGKFKCYTSDLGVAYPYWETIAVRKGSTQLLESVNRLMLRLHEAGILVAIDRRWSANWDSTK